MGNNEEPVFKVRVVRPCFIRGEAKQVGDIVKLSRVEMQSACSSRRCEQVDADKPSLHS